MLSLSVEENVLDDVASLVAVVREDSSESTVIARPRDWSSPPV